MTLLSEVCEIGDATLVHDGGFKTLGFLSDPRPGMLIFVESPRFLRAALRTAGVAAIVTTPELADAFHSNAGVAVCEIPRLTFHKIHTHLANNTDFYGVDFQTVIDPSAEVHPSAYVASRRVRIGAEVTIGPNATVLERCTLEQGCTVHSGVVLGSVGFQTTHNSGRLSELVHAGELVLEQGVAVLANAVVATAVFRQASRIGRDSRIGACAFISHNVNLGERCYVGHGAVVNGNVTAGDDVWIGPSATIANNLTIGGKAYLSLGSVVISDVPPAAHLSGNFAVDHRALLRFTAKLR